MNTPLIIFEDNHLLIANKPSGISTQDDPSQPHLVSCESLLKHFIKERDGKKGGVFLTSIFRLDKPVSGITLFAKSQKALSRLQEAQRERSYTKEYIALISPKKRENPAPLKEELLEDYLLHDDFIAHVIPPAKAISAGAKKSQLIIRKCEYRGIIAGHKIYSVHIELLTGRYHQIRAQLSSRGWPILGDTKYGGEFAQDSKQGICFDERNIALHHKRLSFFHPVKKEGQETSPPLLSFTVPAAWELS